MKKTDVIDFLKHATPTILDLSQDSIEIICDDNELMDILKETAKEYEKGYKTTVNSETSLSAYNSMGWYLAAALRNDIQDYYRLRFGVTMAEFLQLKKYDKIPNQRANTSAFYKNAIREEYKKRFDRTLVFPDEMRKGIFITLEGPEGSGKTTIMKKIEKLFKDLDYDVVLTREPGGVEIAEEIRNVILDKKNTKMDTLTETLLYAASRRQHLAEVVIPALEAGKIVVCDRYIDSSIAYQGFARGVGAKLVKDINEKVVGDYMPDLTLYFDLDPAVGLERINKNPNREVNRLDVEKLDFHTKVREGYLKIHFLEPDRVKLIHAEQTVEKVWQHTQNVLLDFLKKEEA